jgi:VRR-NUC domain
MAVTPEGAVKRDVKKFLKENHIWYFMPVSNGMGQVGIPDFICCCADANGRFLAIETKAPGKRGNTTANQERVLKEIAEHGGLWIVVDDVQQLKEYLGYE